MLSDDSVKELGHNTAKIKLHKEVIVELPYEVVSE
jgi:ribosomal protein L9